MSRQLCSAITKQGTRCTRTASCGSCCKIHNVASTASAVVEKGNCTFLTGKNVPCSHKEKYVGCGYCGKHENKGKAKRKIIFDDRNDGDNKEEDKESCPICLEEITNKDSPLSCGHWVHRGCQIKWGDKCSICRQTISLSLKEWRQIEKREKKENDVNSDSSDDGEEDLTDMIHKMIEITEKMTKVLRREAKLIPRTKSKAVAVMMYNSPFFNMIKRAMAIPDYSEISNAKIEHYDTSYIEQLVSTDSILHTLFTQ